MAASSSAPPYLNEIRCLSISAKYSLASLLVLVPKPVVEENLYFLLWTHGAMRNWMDLDETEAQTFVVLYVPRLVVFCLFLPLVKLWDAVEGQFLLVLGRLQVIQ